jgi:hypothetical protein
MLEKLNQAAENAAEHVSRRQFVRRFGRGAMALAGGLAALLACNATEAGRRPGRHGRRNTKTACSNDSVPACVGKYVGNRCGAPGFKCQLIEGSNSICECRKGS